MANLIDISISLIPSLIAGMALGMTFFLIMWFSVKRGVLSLHPVRWFLLGFLLRMSIAVAGFYFLAKENWLTLLICLLGFVIARELVRRLVVSRHVSSPDLLNLEQDNVP